MRQRRSPAGRSAAGGSSAAAAGWGATKVDALRTQRSVLMQLQHIQDQSSAELHKLIRAKELWDDERRLLHQKLQKFGLQWKKADGELEQERAKVERLKERLKTANHLLRTSGSTVSGPLSKVDWAAFRWSTSKLLAPGSTYLSLYGWLHCSFTILVLLSVMYTLGIVSSSSRLGVLLKWSLLSPGVAEQLWPLTASNLAHLYFPAVVLLALAVEFGILFRRGRVPARSLYMCIGASMCFYWLLYVWLSGQEPQPDASHSILDDGDLSQAGADAATTATAGAAQGAGMSEDGSGTGGAAEGGGFGGLAMTMSLPGSDSAVVQSVVTTARSAAAMAFHGVFAGTSVHLRLLTSPSLWLIVLLPPPAYLTLRVLKFPKLSRPATRSTGQAILSRITSILLWLANASLIAVTTLLTSHLLTTLSSRPAMLALLNWQDPPPGAQFDFPHHWSAHTRSALFYYLPTVMTVGIFVLRLALLLSHREHPAAFIQHIAIDVVFLLALIAWVRVILGIPLAIMDGLLTPVLICGAVCLGRMLVAFHFNFWREAVAPLDDEDIDIVDFDGPAVRDTADTADNDDDRETVPTNHTHET